VRVTPPGSYSADLYVDQETGAFLRVVVAPENPFTETRIRIDDYAEFAPGKKVVSHFHIENGSPIDDVLVKSEYNPAIDPAELLPPKPDAAWTYASPQALPIGVDVNGGSGPGVRVSATVNGRTGTFLLDSGTRDILLFKPFADKVGLEILGDSADVAGAKLARVNELGVGPNVLKRVVVNVVDDSSSGLDGVLGYPFLAGTIVHVDLAAATMTLLDPAITDLTPAKGAAAFPIDLTTRQPQLPVTFADGVGLRALVDSGDDVFSVVSDNLRDRRELARKSGETSTDCAVARRIDVGPFRHDNVSMCFAARAGAVLGLGFLRHYNWTFDYPEYKLVLTPNGL